MKLKAKIKPEYLDLILTGKKKVEVRALESTTLTDGERTHTFSIIDIKELNWRLWSNVFSGMFPEYRPVVGLTLGKELNK